jgi:hypothetical protein
VIAGLTLSLVGAAALIRVAGALADYAYPILWWGVLLLVDSWNTHRHGLSLWRHRGRQFLAMTVPLSVLVWLFFEALNLAAPQWRYHSRIRDPLQLVPLGFASFATVIPIVIESWWLISGRRNLPEWPVRWLARHKTFACAAAALVTIVPLFNDVFWLNQGMWLAPALALAPFTPAAVPSPGYRGVWTLAGAGLLAGLLWETFNYPSLTGWHYVILSDAPHLFQMPLPGYFGFVPFALSILIVYEWQRRYSPKLLWGAVLYAADFVGLYALTILYTRHGLWVYY